MYSQRSAGACGGSLVRNVIILRLIIRRRVARRPAVLNTFRDDQARRLLAVVGAGTEPDCRRCFRDVGRANRLGTGGVLRDANFGRTEALSA